MGELCELNPTAVLPDSFEYVDLESVAGTDMISHRREEKLTAPSRAQRLASFGDIFYQTVRPYQKNNYFYELPDEDYVFSTGYAQLRPLCDGRFLFSSLQRDQFVSCVLEHCTGTSYPAINANDLAALFLAVPIDAEEQRLVGSILKPIDSLITLHQRKCQYRGLYGYLSWEQRKWSEYVSISTDMVDPRSGNYDNLPHVGPGNMESFTGRLYDNVNTVKDDALISGKFHFNPGDIIYGKINPQLGKYTYAQFEGLASADAYVLNGKNGLTQEFLFGILQTKAFFDYSVSVSMRSGMPKINRDELNAFEFLAPNESEQRAIGDILLKLDDLITLHQ